jgi:hypothetical protein
MYSSATLKQNTIIGESSSTLYYTEPLEASRIVGVFRDAFWFETQLLAFVCLTLLDGILRIHTIDTVMVAFIVKLDNF